MSERNIFPLRPAFIEADVSSGFQKGRTFIVTGGNAGLGYELCKLLFATGATAYMGARSTASLQIHLTVSKVGKSRSMREVALISAYRDGWSILTFTFKLRISGWEYFPTTLTVA
ncbi:hypothetical protein M426DRAFT_26674 [Hypoxylon sp. CI-4A]|nr:hypothetical protein M426DRAFT_26674 [Hypoxylon sp. CI-4A]